MDSPNIEKYFLISLVLGGGIFLFVIFLPYIGALLLGGTLTVLFNPLYKKMAEALGQRETLAASLAILLVIVLLLAPVVFFGYQIYQESRDVYEAMNSGNRTLEDMLSAAESSIQKIIPGVPDISLNFREVTNQVAEFIVRNINNIFSGIAEFTITLFLGIFAFYFFLKDGRKIIQYFTHLSPLQDKYDYEIIHRLKVTINSVIKGTLAVAILQGLMTGIGFFIFGIPNPTLWGGVAAIAAMVPSLGTLLVIAPAVAYLFFFESALAALGLTIWGVVIVGLIDNFLSPRFMKRGGINVNPFLILLSVLGGIYTFGIPGIIIGPLALSFFIAITEVYTKEFEPTHTRGSNHA